MLWIQVKCQEKLQFSMPVHGVLSAGASLSSASVITLREADKVDVSEITSFQDCVEAAADAETVSHFEQVVTDWCKVIVQVRSASQRLKTF